MTTDHICPKCGEDIRLAWLSGDPPEPYGDVCGCPDENFTLAREEKTAQDAESRRGSYSCDEEAEAAFDREDARRP